MAGFTAASDDHLIRSNLWSKDLKDVLEEELFAQKYVKMITDFPDGDTLNIPSIGAMESSDYTEDTAVSYTRMDTGNFTFTIDQYKSSATYITNKHKQDTYYMNELVSSFVPKQSRALMEAMETKILDVGPSGQTAANANAINGADHRWVASGTNEVMTTTDFAKAKYALRKANVPMTNLVAIVDPSVEFELSTLTGLSDVTYNPKWEGIVRDGMSTGMRFSMNVYGFDVYVSDFLKLNSGSEQIGGAGPTSTAGVNNLFFSAAPDVMPIIGNIRQAPKVDSEYNKDFQREEYVTTCRYGFKLFRPENMVCVLSDTDQV